MTAATASEEGEAQSKITGFGFALLYTIVGIPLARFADKANRVWIMTVCVALWSLMTALCFI